MICVERAETTETSIDCPKLVLVIPRKLVNIDVAGDVNTARKVASVVLSRRLQFLRHRRHVAVLPNGVGTAYSQPSVVGGDTHRLSKCSEVSIECAVIISHDDRFTRLIRGNDQADPELFK